MPRPKLPPRPVQRKNSPYFYIRYAGKDYSTGTKDYGEALRWAEKFIQPHSQSTIADLLQYRLENLQSMQRARYQTSIYLQKKLLEFFGHLLPEDITLSLIGRYMTARQESPGSLREELIELKATLNFARKNNWIKEVPYIPLPPKMPPRQRWLSKMEIRKLLSVTMSQHLRVFIMLALTTGQRKGAILGLTWDRCNLERGWLDFNDPNLPITNKRRAVVPISEEMITFLQHIKQFAQSNHVVEYQGKGLADVKKSFERTINKAGLKDVTPHTLKHTAISQLAEARFTVQEIADLTATSPKTVATIYRKVNPESLRGLAQSLSANLADFM